jgi:DeoR family fructose operon transcriptional repressor
MGATYFTNSLPLAQKLQAKGCRTFMPGGEVSPISQVLTGPDTNEAIRRCHFTIGFFGTNGADPENGFTTPGVGESAVKQISLDHTLRPYVICDSSKFSTISLVQFARFEQATIITDRLDREDYRASGTIIEVRGTKGKSAATSGNVIPARVDGSASISVASVSRLRPTGGS